MNRVSVAVRWGLTGGGKVSVAQPPQLTQALPTGRIFTPVQTYGPNETQVLVGMSRAELSGQTQDDLFADGTTWTADSESVYADTYL